MASSSSSRCLTLTVTASTMPGMTPRALLLSWPSMPISACTASQMDREVRAAGHMIHLHSLLTMIRLLRTCIPSALATPGSLILDNRLGARYSGRTMPCCQRSCMLDACVREFSVRLAQVGRSMSPARRHARLCWREGGGAGGEDRMVALAARKAYRLMCTAHRHRNSEQREKQRETERKSRERRVRRQPSYHPSLSVIDSPSSL